MKHFLKRFWIVIVIAAAINLPLLIMGSIRTNQSVTLKGDTTIVENFVEIDNAYSQTGSFSTIYVISLDHSTILQNLLVGASHTSEVSELPEHYLHFTDTEIAQMGRIQHQSSILYSIIQAYQEASKVDSKIHIEYTFDAYVIAYYDRVSEFRIGDRIIGINDILAETEFEAFKEAFNQAKEGDVYVVERDKQKLSIPYTKENMRVSGYAFYTIDQDTVFPSYVVKPTNVGGPSGGLLQTLALYNALIEEDITRGRKIAGTGTIETDGTVGPIGGIQQKIYTAFDDDIEIFLCPEENYEDALIAYNSLRNKERMKLYKVSTFAEALEVLRSE